MSDDKMAICDLTICMHNARHDGAPGFKNKVNAFQCRADNDPNTCLTFLKVGPTYLGGIRRKATISHGDLEAAEITLKFRDCASVVGFTIGKEVEVRSE